MIGYLESIHLFCTVYMFAVVVFVHFIQYPMLKNVPEIARAQYNKKYCDRAGFVIAPAMVMEAFSAVLLTYLFPILIYYLGLFLVGVLWIVTFFYSVPAHTKLCENWDLKAHNKLMFSNFIRLLAWGIRCLLFLII